MDPMCNLWFDCPIERLLSNPKNADTPRTEDQRYKDRNYMQYSTSFWYDKVVKYSLRKSPEENLKFRPIKR